MGEGAGNRNPAPPSDAARGSSRRRRRGLVLGALALILALAYVVPSVLAAGTLTAAERRPLSSSPADLGLAFEEAAFPSRDGPDLSGWWLPGGSANANGRAVVLVHGRGSVRDDPGIGYLPLAAGLVERGYAVLLFDLGGHGRSGDARFGLGAREWRDVLGAVDYAAARGVPPDRLAVVGFSAGGAAALAAAVRDPAIGAVAADGVWPDPLELLEAQLGQSVGLPAFYAPGAALAARLLYGIDLGEAVPERDAAALARAGRPLLLIHEGDDRYTDPAQAARVDAAAGPDAESWTVPGAGHVLAEASDPDAYLAHLAAFLGRTIGPDAGGDREQRADRRGEAGTAAWRRRS